MATTQLFVNVSAGSLAAGLVRSLTDMTPVGFPELVIGDGRTYELYFVDGKGGYAAFSGNAAYIPEIAIGNCGTPTGGTFTLKFGANTTGALAYNASAATVQAALEALTSIGSGNCSVSGQGPNYFVVTFKGALAAAPQALIVADPTNLTPSANISVSTLVPGMASPATNAVQVLVLAVNPISFANTWTAITNGWTGKLSTATVAALQAFDLPDYGARSGRRRLNLRQDPGDDRVHDHKPERDGGTGCSEPRHGRAARRGRPRAE
jgi:hypothetical protein